MSLTILKRTSEWPAALSIVCSGVQDVYYAPEFFEVYSRQYGATPEAVFYEDEDIAVFYPYLLRDIKKIPAFVDLRGDWFDITTPYGYGGPLIKEKSTKAAIAFARYLSEFESYAHERSIVTEFIRFHPVLENHRYFKKAHPSGEVAVTDLSLPPEELLRHFKSDKRRGIKKAEQLGVSVELVHELSDAHLKEFLSIYNETMDKNKAEAKYYFNHAQLRELADALGPKLFMMRALREEECVANYLLFQSGPYLTNYLSGHRRADEYSYSKNKVIWEAAKYGHKYGCRFYNLGGGRPSLLSFKAGFATELKVFFTAKNVLLPERYKELLTVANVSEEEAKFFPSYRHPRLYQALL
jgi:hypothetical protein